MNSTKKALAYIVFGTALGVFGFGLIGDIVTLANLSRFPDQVVYYVMASTLLDLLGAIALLILGIRGLFVIHGTDSVKKSIKTISVMMVVWSIISAVCGLILLAMNASFNNNSTIAIGVLNLILLVASIVAFFMSLFNGGDETSKTRIVTALIGFSCLALCWLMGVANAIAGGTFSALISFCTAGSVGCGIALSIVCLVPAKAKKEVIVAPAAAPISGKDPAEEMKKLKELLDAGIITQEQYDQKIQKYVDML